MGLVAIPETAALSVLARRNDFHVIRVAAGTVTAEMVDHKRRRDISDEKFVCEAMREHLTRPNPEQAVSVRGHRGFPRPTLGLVALVHLWPKALLGGLFWPSRHRLEYT
jgi:hypothetical protein